MAKPDWDAIRDAWEAGTPDQDLTKAHGPKCKTIRERAAAEGWDATRRPKPRAHTQAHARTRDAAAEGAGQTGATVKPPPAEYHDEFPADQALAIGQHTGDWQSLRNRSMTLLQVCDSPRMLAAIAGALKLSSEGQRKALGLDKAEPEKTAADGNGVIVLPAKVPLKSVPPDSDDWAKLVEKRTQE